MDQETVKCVPPTSDQLTREKSRPAKSAPEASTLEDFAHPFTELRAQTETEAPSYPPFPKNNRCFSEMVFHATWDNSAMTMSLTKFLPVILLFGLIALIASPEGESKEAATPEEQIDWAAHNAIVL